MQAIIDVLENDLISKYPNILEILLCDHTTKKNIFWATDNYQELGEAYQFDAQILIGSITGENGHIIVPRVKKTKTLQQLPQSCTEGNAQIIFFSLLYATSTKLHQR